MQQEIRGGVQRRAQPRPPAPARLRGRGRSTAARPGPLPPAHLPRPPFPFRLAHAHALRSTSPGARASRPFHHETARGGRARLRHTDEQRKDRDREAEPAQGGRVPTAVPHHAPPGGRHKPLQRGRPRAEPETKGVARSLARGRPRAPQGRPWAVCALYGGTRALTALDAPRTLAASSARYRPTRSRQRPSPASPDMRKSTGRRP